MTADAFDRPMTEIGRWSIGTLVGLLWCAAMLVGWRRLAGALGKPLEPHVLLAVGALTAALAAGARVGWQQLDLEYGSRHIGRWVAILSTAGVFGLGAALSLRGTAPAALWAFWALLVAGECWAWRPAAWRRLRRRPGREPTVPLHRIDPAEVPRPHFGGDFATDDVPAEDVLQQLTRSRAADGSEQVTGWLRMPFAAGQRTANVHVAFCPPFDKTPQWTAEQFDGPPMRIKTAQLLPHGARLDLKLSAAAEQSDRVLIRFSARSPHEA